MYPLLNTLSEYKYLYIKKALLHTLLLIVFKILKSILKIVTIEKTDALKTSFFQPKNFISRSVFGEFQLTQIPLNFKTSFCNLKIRGSVAKACVAFLLL